jgi:HK97 family phage portal protein
MVGIMQSLARIITPHQKINPAGEGNYHPGPYTVSGGILPHAWGQYLNWWQMDLDPLQTPSSSIVEACVWAYVRAIAQLPGYHKRELGNGGTETVTTSALSRLLRSPNPYQTPSDFLVHLIRSLLLNGNSYWVAQRNDRAEVTALHWTDPRACRVREIMVQGQPFSEVFYEISTNPLFQFDSILGRTSLVVPARDVLHIKLATPQHPLVGVTWLKALDMEMAASGAMQAAATTFATNMSRPSGILTSDQQLTKVQVDELRAKWNEQVSGINSGGVAILNQNVKFQPLTISNQDAQIIDQRKLNDQAVAAVFGVPMILLGVNDTATQKSSEAVMAEWLAAGLGWLINHIEQAFDSFIGLDMVAAGREWTEYDTRVLLRSAFRERIEGLARGVQGGIYSPNEARALEGYAAAVDGDEPRVQMQVVPLSAWDKAPTTPVAPQPAPQDAAKPADQKPQSNPDQQKAFALFLLERTMASQQRAGDSHAA